MNNIYLIGIMGCGKTTIGKKVAQMLHWNFFDVDSEIEKNQKIIIRDIFELYDEIFFRDLESNALKELSNMREAVISTGGGIVLREENIKLMRSTGKIIWIKRSIDEIVKKVETNNRPIIRNNPEKLYQIYAEREPIYKQSADFTVINDCLPQNSAQKIADYVLI